MFWLRDITKSIITAKKFVKVTYTWIVGMIKEHVAINPNVNKSLLKNYIQEKFRLKIEKLIMCKAREKASVW